ncbi:TRAF3-interacting JNK-activating modulator-like [Acipenser ruthenus]|uniref:TRAF3-interacting JNK-activating modulator-like n=1 Tax=Acipenser ruthenus TaxID=7906 RepID=UPI002741A52A|nr:TRAF3-interacting JNK-activating modulator-like [Acipenser ruthenus]XP_058860735.1 TRAF3-interacting JNK-activating modulator-like [Acipenser ruthenus]XP_058860736.1 TRAF3-interacting JNK-activating modulator-like [Acipenser ruthenus]
MMLDEMTMLPQRPPKRRWLNVDTYEEKTNLRVSKRECLRGRFNRTMCRSAGRVREGNVNSEQQCKRQLEFLKRRQLPVTTPPSSEVEEANNCEPKPTLRSAKVQRPDAAMNRRSVVMSHDLGITWPEFPVDKAPWLSKGTLYKSTQPPGLLGNQLPGGPARSSGRLQHETFKKDGTVRRDRGTQTSEDVKQDSSVQTESGVTAVMEKEVLELSAYLQEALRREQALKHKLSILQQLMSSLLCSSDKLWTARYNEDLMKCKIGSLESQLQVCMQGGTKKGIIEMGEQKLRLEEKAKESLKRVLMEKSVAEEKVQSLQRAQLALQQENSQLKDSYEKVKESWAELKSKHTQSVDQLHVLQSKLERAESREVALQARMEGLQQDRDELASRIDMLEEDQHLKREQLGTLTEKLKSLEDQKATQDVTGTSVWNINSQPFHTGDRFSMDQAGQGDTKLRHQLLEIESKLGAKETECSELRGELGNLEDEYQSCQSKLRQCREELNRFQGRRSQTRRSKWICLSVLLVVVAIAASAFYPDLYEHMNLLFRLLERRLNQYLN